MLPLEEESARFRLINADVTGLCNLRCRFCFNDFRKADKSFLPLTTFDGLMETMTLVPEQRFFISCLYEPTLHPQWEAILTRIPPSGRQQAFFTTNLARKLDDSVLLAMSRANVHHINISLETLRADIYRMLCGSARFGLFLENVRRLAEFCRRNSNAPSLHYVTMVLKANYPELITLVKTAARRFHAAVHELRTPYYDDYPNQSFVESQLLPRKALEQLVAQLQPLGLSISCDFSIWQESLSDYTCAEKAATRDAFVRRVPQRYLDVRVNANATAQFYGEETPVSLLEQTSIRHLFETRLHTLYNALPQFFHDATIPAEICETEKNLPEGQGRIVLERLSKFQQSVFIRGWYECPEQTQPRFLHWKQELACLEVRSRPDLNQFGSLPPGWCRKGFRCVVRDEQPATAPDSLHFLHVDTGKARCRWTAAR